MVNNGSKTMTTSSSRFNRSPHVTFSTNLTSPAVAFTSSKMSNSFGNNIHLAVSGQRLLCQGPGSASLLDKSSLSKGTLAHENGNSAFRRKARLAEYPNQSANDFIWRKIEAIVERMQNEDTGVPIRAFKNLMSTVPSVFTGADLVSWIIKHLGAEEVLEAIHLASMVASMGYLFPIADHALQVKNDAHSLYRFQTPCLYPSRCCEVDNIEYAVYLCKRTMQNKQRLELADFEAERLATLQSFYWHKWEFIYLQAEAEAKVDKKRDKVERLVLESQEKGFWDCNRPVSGAANNNDIDMRKLFRSKREKKAVTRSALFPVPSGAGNTILWNSLEGVPLADRVAKMQAALERKRVRISKAVESLHAHNELYLEFDMLLVGGGGGGLLAGITTSATSGGGGSSGGGSGAGSAAVGGGGSSTGVNPSGPVSAAQAQAAATAAAAAMTVSPTGGPPGGGQPTPSPLETGIPSNGSDISTSALNPWVSDNPDFWACETSLREVSIRRVKKWSFGIHELLKDPAGREEIQKWLEKEFSAENLHFWEACQDLKGAPLRDLNRRIEVIYNQFLSPGAIEPINVDSKVAEMVTNRVARSHASNPDRFCFEMAEEHIFKLMTSDSYYRYLRSNVFKELMAGQKKKSKKRFPADIRQRLEIE